MVTSTKERGPGMAAQMFLSKFADKEGTGVKRIYLRCGTVINATSPAAVMSEASVDEAWIDVRGIIDGENEKGENHFHIRLAAIDAIATPV